MTHLRIRDAAPADCDLIAQWMLAMAWETEQKRLDPATVHAGVGAGLADPAKARYFVAMREAQTAGHETIAVPAGTLMLTREWSDWRNGEWWWIQSVYVAAEHRRQGVYDALHSHVAALAQATPDVVGLRLYVERGNAAAQRTYRAQGMVDAGYDLFEQEFGAGERSAGE
ncbi:acetyltransferase (GNAT) family [Lysobacter enzymogenes]|uniref:Acetyltransferase (GNAT) family n=1 Tax=Lysobacter enzymogenes TaxID=69 RepID=A0A0S2DP72_LYSEN|nr:GNAT family N-acetyltransferase [Lysobacter enzymogenes]ALN60386.1 acetyltransferase (GNAT) family [Lysobacter enzymogenes]QCW28330.1 GNAT family N-acetyltransferase [Lysobacter enzymogenes]